MLKKLNIRLIITVALSLADEIIVLAVVLVLLWWAGIKIPIWAIVIIALFFLGISFIIYRTLRKNPELGFENMVSLSGVAVEPITRKGTVRINGELWFARSKGEKIEAGAKIMVVEQTGLKLTVIRKPAEKE
jgi:membrane-bound ClpP family serine protease